MDCSDCCTACDVCRKMMRCNYSAGLRIYCADREKVIQEFKNPIAVGDFIGFLNVTVKVLNSYDEIKKKRG